MRILALVICAFFLVGCATQSDFDALKKRVDSLEAQQKTEQATKEANRNPLQVELANADSERAACRATAEKRYNDRLSHNGTPIAGKPGWYAGSQEVSKEMSEEQSRANADCQREYEDAVQTAKLKYGQ
jgi:outer membrane murein-binding lipoprotein Lpp